MGAGGGEFAVDEAADVGGDIFLVLSDSEEKDFRSELLIRKTGEVEDEQHYKYCQQIEGNSAVADFFCDFFKFVHYPLFIVHYFPIPVKSVVFPLPLRLGRSLRKWRRCRRSGLLPAASP